MLAELTMAATLATNSPQLSEAELAQMAWRFTPHTYAEAMSGGTWQPYPWLRYMGNIIADAVARGRGRVLINCPPRHGKSELLSHWVPVWYLDNLPAKHVILTSYESGVAMNWGRLVRNEFERNPGCRTRLREDSTSASRWHSATGGGMVTAGAGGPITGLGGDLLIVDDPHKSWAEAHSPLFQDRVWEWFNTTFYTRCEPGATIIVVMQRWAEDDLTGRLLSRHEDDWQHIRLPAIAEADDPLGRAVGEPLCPERFSLPELLDIRKAVGHAVWEALYQQKPGGEGQGLAYEAFTTERNVSEQVVLVPSLPLDITLDFNIDPGMHMVIGQHDERADRIMAHDVIHGPRMAIPALMESFGRWLTEHGGWRWPELQVFGDASGHSEDKQTASTDYNLVAAHVRKLGIQHYRIRVPKNAPRMKDSLNSFAEACRDIDGQAHYLVHPRCEGLLADYRHVKLGPDGKIVKSNSALTHFSDCERYRIDYLRPIGFVTTYTPGGRVYA